MNFHVNVHVSIRWDSEKAYFRSIINKRNIMDTMKRNLTIILLLFLALAEMKAQALPFRLSKGAGTFRLGIVAGDKSRWLDECELEKTGDRTYIIKDALLGIGKIRLMICPLTDTKGLLVEVSGSRLPENLSLCWAFGACNEDEALSGQGAVIFPEACRDNVFSDEENAFTVYYGASMALRVTQGIAPVGSELRLSDARRQTSPLELYHSGKKTDAPVISSLYSWNAKEKCYFCFYKQNAGADYNYFMLPQLFEKESKR